MKAVDALSEEEYAAQMATWKNLIKILEKVPKHALIEYSTGTGYANYTFRGTILNELVDQLGRMPTADEIIMLVDTGFSHFGAQCSIHGREFYGRVNTD